MNQPLPTESTPPAVESIAQMPPGGRSEGDSRSRGAESRGDIPGTGGSYWQIFSTAKGFMLVVTVAKGFRVHRRIPKRVADKPLDTRESRVRFAKSIAPEVRTEALEERERRLPVFSAASRSKKLTFAEVAELWTSGELTKRFPEHCPAKASVDADKSRLRVLARTIGNVPIDDPNWLDHAERAMASLPDTCRTPATRRQYAQFMRRVLQLAVFPLRSDNPIPKNFLPRNRRSTAIQWLYPSEEARIAAYDAIPVERRLFWGVLAREGMRDGSEAACLTWECLDLERGTIRLDRNKTKYPRTWKLDPSVCRSLARWKEIREERLGEEPASTSLVLVDENGAPWDGTRLAEVFRDDLRLAGVKRHELFEKVDGVRAPIRAYDLRATFVTVKLAIGWTEAQISLRTGHQSSQMIARYRRIAQTAEELEIEDFLPLDALLFGEPVTPPVTPPDGPPAGHDDGAPGDDPQRDSRDDAMPRDTSHEEGQTLNPLVSGSSPGWPTKTSRSCPSLVQLSGPKSAGGRTGNGVPKPSRIASAVRT
jgi:integrase